MSDQGLGEASGLSARPQPGTSVAHTPGPWIIEPKAAKGAWIAGRSGEWAALACGNSDERARANALLIAAAPELLSALIELKEATNERALRGSKHVPAMRRQHDAMTAARAAIAKATFPSASIGGS